MHERHSRVSGNPCQQKMTLPRILVMGSRFRGNDAAEQSARSVPGVLPLLLKSWHGALPLNLSFRASSPRRDCRERAGVMGSARGTDR
jgi:hypothetical protein